MCSFRHALAECLVPVRRPGALLRTGAPVITATARLPLSHRIVKRTGRCPRQDSNLRARLRRPVLCPLSYGGYQASDLMRLGEPKLVIDSSRRS